MPSIAPVSETVTERKMALEKPYWIFWPCWILLCLYRFGLYSKSYKIETGLLLSFVIVCGKLFDTESFFLKSVLGTHIQ